MYNPELGMGEADLEEGDEGMDLTGLKDEELEEQERNIVVRLDGRVRRLMLLSMVRVFAYLC